MDWWFGCQNRNSENIFNFAELFAGIVFKLDKCKKSLTLPWKLLNPLSLLSGFFVSFLTVPFISPY